MPKIAAIDAALKGAGGKYSCKVYAKEMGVGPWQLACIICRLVKLEELNRQIAATKQKLSMFQSGRHMLQHMCPQLFSNVSLADAEKGLGVRRHPSTGVVAELTMCPIIQAAQVHWDEGATEWLP